MFKNTYYQYFLFLTASISTESNFINVMIRKNNVKGNLNNFFILQKNLHVGLMVSTQLSLLILGPQA